MNRFAPLLIALLLLAAAVYGFAFLAAHTYAAAAAAAAAAESIATAGKQESFQQNVAAFMRGTESERAELGTFITKDRDVVSIIAAIEAAAKREKVSVEVSSIAVAPAPYWKYHEPLDVTLSAQGSFPALAAFATNLESLPWVSHLLTMTAGASDMHTWTSTFTLEFAKEKAASGQAAQTPPNLPASQTP